MASPALPVLDLALASDPATKPILLKKLKSALFETGFLYLTNHGVPPEIIAKLASYIPALFTLPKESKVKLTIRNNPHFVGYSAPAEEDTLGVKDYREKFDFATELPVVWNPEDDGSQGRDFTKLYWRLRGPNNWPDESENGLEGFREALETYMKTLEEFSLTFVHLIEEAFGIPVGTFDSFFMSSGPYLRPQNRLKILKYPPSPTADTQGQGVGAHRDSTGWLTFLHQVGNAPEDAEGLQVLNPQKLDVAEWISVPLVPNSFVVNFGNAFEAATSGGVRATVHRVVTPKSTSPPRFSIPFFMGLPLDITINEIKKSIPEEVHQLRANSGQRSDYVLDPKWESEELGVAQMRTWFRSHKGEAGNWYGAEVVENYLK